ncbi:uncharacterized protein LOC108603509 isoform X2 [Drosophila busckii]|uniref:uncharacterized protein LOC108603509 isoform X2 n=1 Tax=Drosophila busckii TaxID=30019 RepID=UPI00083EC4B0|nr:uncharacterized protein LOC108603509 isoform X2 [Drosophila busckii]
MSTARFARQGRVRICILMSMFVVLLMMIVIYHMSQQQLDETRAFRLRCEQNQERLNLELQSVRTDQVDAEKKLEITRVEKYNIQKSYDKQQNIENLLQLKNEAQMDKFKQLNAKYIELQSECVKSKKQHIKDTNAFEQKLEALLLQLQQLQQGKQQQQADAWKGKYEEKIRDLQATITEFRAHCYYVPSSLQQQFLNADHSATPNASPTQRSRTSQITHSLERSRNNKSFNEQVQVSAGLYKVNIGNLIKITNTATKTNSGSGGEADQRLDLRSMQPSSAPKNNSLILNSVENFQIVPKSIKAIEDVTEQQDMQILSSLVASSLVDSSHETNSSTQIAEDTENASKAPKGSSSGQPSLAIPPAKPSAEIRSDRKLPENVAPLIPYNFDGKAELALDPDTAAEELPKNKNNNRYLKMVNDLVLNKNLEAVDSGAHEVKDALNEQNFDLPIVGGEHNLFDSDLNVGHEPALNNKRLAAAIGDDDVILGDVALKPQNSLDGVNLNNEIAGDQGKDFADGVHLDDGIDEDQDEDDYNMPARKRGADAAIRN